jgi:hypothetical protein
MSELTTITETSKLRMEFSHWLSRGGQVEAKSFPFAFAQAEVIMGEASTRAAEK